MGDEYESVDDYVASKVFDFKCEINPTSAKLKAIYPSLTEPVRWAENSNLPFVIYMNTTTMCKYNAWINILSVLWAAMFMFEFVSRNSGLPCDVVDYCM